MQIKILALAAITFIVSMGIWIGTSYEHEIQPLYPLIAAGIASAVWLAIVSIKRLGYLTTAIGAITILSWLAGSIGVPLIAAIGLACGVALASICYQHSAIR